MIKYIIDGVKYDVTKIRNMSVSKRLFKFNNPQLEYVFKFQYKEYSENTLIVPIIVANVGICGIGALSASSVAPNTYKDVQIFYKNETDGEEVMNQIKQRQRFMEKHIEDLEKKLERDFKRQQRKLLK